MTTSKSETPRPSSSVTADNAPMVQANPSTPPAPSTSAAPGYQSHGCRFACRNTPMRPVATLARSTEADPNIRVVAAVVVTAFQEAALTWSRRWEALE